MKCRRRHHFWLLSRHFCCCFVVPPLSLSATESFVAILLSTYRCLIRILRQQPSALLNISSPTRARFSYLFSKPRLLFLPTPPSQLNTHFYISNIPDYCTPPTGRRKQRTRKGKIIIIVILTCLGDSTGTLLRTILRRQCHPQLIRR